MNDHNLCCPDVRPASVEVSFTPRDLQASLTAFIRQRFQVADGDELFGPTLDLWDEGYLDSTEVVEVLAFLEMQIGTRIPEELLFEPAFATIEGMVRLVSEL